VVDILLREACSAEAELDFVNMRFGHLKVAVPYQTALDIARHLRMACKEAMRLEREPVKNWAEISEIIEITEAQEPPRANRTFRRSRLIPTLEEWATKYEGTLIRICFDNESVAMHWSDGLVYHAWLRQAARAAKAWAGDSSKRMVVTGTLTNAEDNYRLNLH